MLAGGSAALQMKTTFAAGSSSERVSPSLPAVSNDVGRGVMPQYTVDAFSSRVGEVFTFHRRADGSDTPLLLELVEVEVAPRGASPGGREPFSLLFALRSTEAADESTLHLRHAEFEPCAWFVNRVVAPNRDATRAYYEAVFG
jgi:hypothetical protein